MNTPITYKVIARPKLSPYERREQRALEVSQAKAMADALLENESVPTDVQDELNEMFGNDGEF